MSFVSPESVLEHHVAAAPARDLAAKLRYLANLKNVRLTIDQINGAVNWAGKCLADPHMPSVSLNDVMTTDPATRVIDRILDVLAARDVLHLASAFIDGVPSPDPLELMERANASVHRFTGGAVFYRWPDAMEMFERHYGHLPRAPITLTQDDGSTTTSYFCNGALHRDPAQGPAWQRKTAHGEKIQYVVRGKLHRDPLQGPAQIDRDADGHGFCSEEYFVDGQLHRPAGLGPAITVTDRDRQVVFAAFVEKGKLHRDPEDGPALHDRLPQSGERIEYCIEGELHRNAQGGPARIEIRPDGSRIEEYREAGQFHRPSKESPALTETDASGRCIRTLYAEHGVRHRDPKEGPAWWGYEDGLEKTEYMTHDQFHREEADGPALIHRDPETGMIILEEYRQRGELHREGGPAHVARNKEGRVILSYWCKNGQIQRDQNDGPAWVYYDAEAKTTEEHYACEGYAFHRDPSAGPAAVVRNSRGEIIEQHYWAYGELVDMPEAQAPNRRSRRAEGSRVKGSRSKGRKKVRRG